MVSGKKVIVAFSFLAFFLLILSLLLTEVSRPQKTDSRAEEAALSSKIPPSITPIATDCHFLAEPVLIKEGSNTEIKQELATSWGKGSPLELQVKEVGRIDRVDLYLSGNGAVEVRIINQENEEETETVVKQIIGQGWVSFDFNNEAVLLPGEKYTINVRRSPQAIAGTKVNLHRGPFWQWAMKVFLKPCVSIVP